MSGVMCQRHAGDFELTALYRREEAIAIPVRRVLPPVDRDAGDFARPPEAAVVRPVGGGLGDVERFVDEAAMQLEHHRLRVGVADVRVRVMDKENFVDHEALPKS